MHQMQYERYRNRNALFINMPYFHIFKETVSNAIFLSLADSPNIRNINDNN